ncbi:MAG: hypothetical protein QG657_5569, partial [Acidobacteriota bacterium]|nr:hypothetical protein [Acidobacteriota bacterium]
MAMNTQVEKNARSGLEVAVIGMAARFPGAKNINEFWNNLKNGVESITFFSDEELEKAGVDSDLIKDPNYVKAFGALDGVEYFDASFFGYTPREAEIMNPQMRFFHECTWDALEDAGYNPESYGGLIGVYAGASSSFIWEGRALLSDKNKEIGYFAANQLTNTNFFPTRISYKFNFKGPSSFIQTACSTSLVAIHWACRSVLSGECHIALAGGVSINETQKQGYIYEEGMILSPDGHCRAFSAEAAGTVAGNGVGIVVLKRLKNAIADRDHIYAIVKGTAVNNDGNRKVGYTAPSVQGQSEVIRLANAIARIEYESIGYVEAHGTGTVMGDSIEIEALTLAFKTDKRNYCPIGSVKTNIGHLDTAAGVAGFIKTILILQHKLVPPSLHFKTPNPKIDFKDSPFYVNTVLRKWDDNGYPRRAGVSSFGIGGTNAHAILEEAPEIKNSTVGRTWKMILLSAKTKPILDKLTKNFLEYLKANPGINFADIAFTLQVGRKSFEHRRMAVCSNTDEAIQTLQDTSSLLGNAIDDDKKRIVFVFDGLGGQYVDMGKELYLIETHFREAMDHCFKVLASLTDINLKEILYPSNTVGAVLLTDSDKINKIAISQLVIFIFEYALAGMLMKWGIIPDAMIGYSFGEYTAACLSGVFSLEDALKIILIRGRLLAEVPGGIMLSVPLSSEEIAPLLPGKLSLAIDNGSSCIVAGPAADAAVFEQEMKQKKLLCMPVSNSVAMHSQMMEPILSKFKKELEKITFNPPKTPYISNLTGTWITSQDVGNPGYLCEHLRKTVRFANGFKELVKKRHSIFIEIGPGRDLSIMTKRFIDNKLMQYAVNLVRPPQKKVSDVYYLLKKIGYLWLYGVNVDWSEFYSDEKRCRVPLPPYPFEGRRYWIEGVPFKAGAGFPGGARSIGFRKNRGIDDYFYISTWRRLPLRAAGFLPGTALPPACWLVFIGNDTGPGDPLFFETGLEEKLRLAGQDVITVTYGTAFQKETAHRFSLNPGKNYEDGYDALFTELVRGGRVPDFIVHCWSLMRQMPGGGEEPGIDRIEETLDLGFYSLINIVRAMETKNIEKRICLAVITTGLHEETSCPLKAAVLGPVKVIPLEFPNIRCRVVDVAPPLLQPGTEQGEQFLDRLIEDLAAPSANPTESMEPITAYSGNYRWVQGFEPVRLKKTGEKAALLKTGGVYLITGGLGGMGLELAHYLAKTVQAKLILIGRSAFQSKDRWEEKVKILEKPGAEVLVLGADVTDEKQMREAIQRAVERFGVINGVIHAAGLPDGKIIRLRSWETSEQVLAPKIKGTLVLEKVLESIKPSPPDFFIICSSLTAVVPAVGQVGYCAANNFVDAFAVSRMFGAKGISTLIISIDWDRWQNTGIAVIAEKLHKKLTGEELEGGLTVKEGIGVFNRILENPFPQVAVSSYDLEIAIKQAWALQAPPVMDMERVEGMTAGGNAAQRPKLETPYEPPRSSTEHFLAASWSSLFGYERIGIHDDFFQLGGDSLLAMAVIAKIHKGLKVRVPIVEFFNTPTIESLAVYIDANVRETTLEVIEPVEKKHYYPVSSAQKRLYILQQMEPGSVAYNESNVIVLEGEPDRKRLAATFKKLIQRHESLRISFMIIGDEPVQRIHDQVPFEIEFGWSPEQIKIFGSPETFFQKGFWSQEAIIKSFIRPFDLSKVPLFRVGTIKQENGKHLLLVDMHHIITDGTSNVILKDEFNLIYSGKSVDLPRLRLQYKDYAHWQNSEEQRALIEEQETYWLNMFAEEVPALNLPTDYPRPSIQSFEGSRVEFILNGKESGTLKLLAKETGATLYISILSIFIILLSRLSGQEEIVVGTPVAARRHADLEKIIGMFVNTLALKNNVPAEASYREFLKELKDRTLKAYENQEYQFESLVEKINAARDIAHNPVFDVMFNLLNMKDYTDNSSLTDLGSSDHYIHQEGTSKFDLTLTAVDFGEWIHLSFEYCTQLFKPATIERFISYLKKILEELSAKIDQDLLEIEILTQCEKDRILYEFNNTRVDYPGEKTVHELFEEQVERTPDRIALVGGEGEAKKRRSEEKREEYPLGRMDACDGIHISYRELNEQSNRLANVLKEKGVEPDTIVGVMMERS